jgi:phosphotransferase system  glucose/maltose/N-acetylglucosamine-specific IIC component
LFRFEHRKQPLVTRRSFVRRLLFAAVLSAVLLAIWTVIGMIGYHTFAGLGWVDAFLNSAMIVGGMGPVDVLNNQPAKIFAGFYAILSGVIFLSVFGLLFGPVFHRFMHRFHLDTDEREESQQRSTESKSPFD